MNAAGAIVIDPKTGDPEKKSGFVVNVETPRKVTIHGNYSRGFFVNFEDAGIELGPYPDPALATVIAERWDGILERAN